MDARMNVILVAKEVVIKAVKEIVKEVARVLVRVVVQVVPVHAVLDAICPVLIPAKVVVSVDAMHHVWGLVLMLALHTIQLFGIDKSIRNNR